MKQQLSRRNLLGRLVTVAAGMAVLPAIKTAKAAVQKVLVSNDAPKGYDPSKHKWVMAIDVNRCIGCGSCVEACKKENAILNEGFKCGGQ